MELVKARHGRVGSGWLRPGGLVAARPGRVRYGEASCGLAVTAGLARLGLARLGQAVGARFVTAARVMEWRSWAGLLRSVTARFSPVWIGEAVKVRCGCVWRVGEWSGDARRSRLVIARRGWVR